MNKTNNNNQVLIEALDSARTPKAIGPYSKATRIDMVHLYMIDMSGNIGLDPKTGELVSDDVGDQTRQTLENMKALLEDNGGSIDSIAKTTIYLVV